MIVGTPLTSSEPPPRREPGYGPVTKTLHWLTVAALATQFTIGYLLDVGGRGPAGAAAAVATPGGAGVGEATSMSSVMTGSSPPTWSSA